VFVATVDAAQGLEWDIVFLSVGVRGGGGGFAGDAHRLCVAFTRARHHLILAGAVRDLAGMPAFRDVVAEARKVEGGVMRAR
jgi:superfamily I DNA and/or RNA helicase